MQTIDNPRIEKFVNLDPDGFVTLKPSPNIYSA